MAEVNRPDNFGRTFNEIDRRLTALERGPTGNLGMSAKYLRITDGMVVRCWLGKQDDGTYGLRIWDSTGALIHDFTTL